MENRNDSIEVKACPAPVCSAAALAVRVYLAKEEVYLDERQTDQVALAIADELTSLEREALALCHKIEMCGASPELTKASIMASRLRQRLSQPNTEGEGPL